MGIIRGLLGVAFLGALGFMLWGLVDAATQPRWAWEKIGRRKGNWIAGYVVALPICGLVTLFGTIDYYTSIRPQLLRARGGSPEAGAQGEEPRPTE